MKVFQNGERVRVTLGTKAGIGVVTLASLNGKSLIVHAETEKLPYADGFAVDPANGKMVLALLHATGDTFVTLHGGTHYQITPL